MGCLASKFDVDQPGYGRPVQYGQPGYGPAVPQQWAQPSGMTFQQSYMAQQESQHIPDTPFLRTASPDGRAWSEYVKTGPLFVDPTTGLLSGPWAECICWCVRFEHDNDWQVMPDYRGGEGPVGGVLSALAVVVSERMDAPRIMSAGQHLEEAAQEALRSHMPLPCQQGQSGSVVQGHLIQGSDDACGQFSFGHQCYGHGQPSYAQQGHGQNYGSYDQGMSYGQPGQPAYGQQPSYGSQPYQQQPQYQGDGAGPMLLGQMQPHSQAAGGGFGKFAMAGAAGLAAGAGGMYLASHAGGIAEGVGHSFEDVCGFDEDEV